MTSERRRAVWGKQTAMSGSTQFDSEEPRTILPDLSQLLVEQSGNGIIVADEHGVIRIFNPEAERQHGVRSQQVAAVEWAERFGLYTRDGRKLPLEETPLYRALRGETLVDAKWSVRRPDGTVRNLIGTATPLRHTDQRLAGAVIITRDETDRLRLEQRFRSLVETTDIVWTTGPTGTVTEDSPSWRAFTGQSVEDYLSGHASDAIHPDDIEPLKEVWAQALRQSRSFEAGYRLRRSDGIYVPMSVRVVPVLKAAGGVREWVGAASDISENKRLEEERAGTLQALQESETRYRFLAEAMPQMVWICQGDGTPEYFNRRYLDYVGMTADDAKARWHDQVHPDDERAYFARWSHSLKTGTPFDIEFRIKRVSDQSYRWHIGRAEPFRSAQGEILKWFGTCTDVDDLRRVERDRATLRERTARAEATAASQEALRVSDEILKQVPDAIILTDLAGNIIRWGGGAERIFGYSAEQATGRPLNFIHRPEIRGTVMGEIIRQIRAAGSFVGEVPCLHLNGREIIVEVSAKALFDGKGEPFALVGVNRDVTDRKRAEDERIQMAKEREAQASTRQSEQRFRTLAESTSTIVWQTDPTGLFPSASPSWQAFTGQNEKIFTSGNGWVAIHPDDLPKFWAGWKEAAEKRCSFELEIRLRRRDGRYVPMAVRAAPVLNDDGSIREWIGATTDITSRLQLLQSERLARQEAEAARQRMALLDSVTKGLIADLGASRPIEKLARQAVPALADWCVIHLRREDRSLQLVALAHVDEKKAQIGAEMLQRYPVDSDLPIGEVFRSGKSQLYAQIDDTMLVAAARDTEHLRMMREFGMTSHLVVPLNAQGRVIGCMSLTQAESGRQFTAEDVALAEEVAVRAALAMEQERLYREMQEARTDAEAANRAKDVFLAMLGHELRNPLAPISTALQLMSLRGSDAFLHERAVIERQVKYLVGLVDDLLDVSRITRGKIELTKQPCEVRDVLAKAIEMSSPLLEQQKHQLKIVTEHEGLRVNGDLARLAQVFSNLVSNAAKYTHAEGEIVITAKRVDGQIVVAVKDNGEGIDAQLLPHVFDLFTQGERTLDRSQGGLGIGLTIVRSLVELHGGSVVAHSEGRGRGSEFEVFLPALAQSSEDADTSTIAKSARSHAGPAHQGMRILVVDDNHDAALLLSDALDTMGYETRVAHDGPSGLQAAAEFEPTIALLDIGLPVMDGYELGRRLRRWSPMIHLVAVTGYGQDADREHSREVGFDHHLVKPLDFEELAIILEEFGGKGEDQVVNSEGKTVGLDFSGPSSK